MKKVLKCYRIGCDNERREDSIYCCDECIPK